MTLSALMKALVVTAPNDALRLAEVPRPVPGPGEVLVKIHASGVNPLDTKIRAGAAPHARHQLPAILGLDMAGIVEQVGPGAERFRLGDAVYGMVGGVGGVQGTLAEYAAVDAALLAHKPVTLTMREAAALPLVAITAWEGLVDRAHVGRGQTVLVHGGAGGVGHVAVQIARAFGASVYATERGWRADYLQSIGATSIDFKAVSVADYVADHTGGLGFDLVYDTAGGATLDASFAAVRRFGHVVSCLGWGTHALAPLSFKAATYSGIFTLPPLLTGEGRDHHGAILSQVARLVDAGQLTPRLDLRRFAFSTVADAYDAIANRAAEGKLVVDVIA
ncbi:MAG: zinc-dependent alcohol dehydrogenase family protein [Proteobacteria bacterium]|nr:zinc-dependent alcohol dehydrogenase family protein [Pseudomonadota bacterium]